MSHSQSSSESSKVTQITQGIFLLVFGGLSLVSGLVEFAFGFQPLSSTALLWALTLFSYPHFTSSYVAFYSSREFIRGHRLTGTILPLLIGAFLFASAYLEQRIWLEHAALFTLCFMYWHFLRQTYGVSLWLGNPLKIPKNLNRQLYLTTITLGVLGILAANQSSQNQQLFGLYVSSLQFPNMILPITNLIAVLLVMGTTVSILWWGSKSNHLNAALQITVPLLAFWIWCDPIFLGSATRALVPAFHGMQYLFFPIAAVGTGIIANPTHRGKTKLYLALFISFVGLGYLLFQTVAKAIGTYQFRGELFASAFVIFLNLHHFILDGVLWRFRDPKVRKRLGMP